MKPILFAGILGLTLMASAPIVAQNSTDTAATKHQLKNDQKADKRQAKADKAERKALNTKQQKKADKAQDKANHAEDKASNPQS
jgi:hypothetical protein